MIRAHVSLFMVHSILIFKCDVIFNSAQPPKIKNPDAPHFETGGCPMNVNDDDDHRICTRFSCFSVNPFESHRRFDCARVVDIDLCYMESDTKKKF